MGDEDKINGDSSSSFPEKEKEELDDSRMHQFDSPPSAFQEEKLDAQTVPEPETAPIASKWLGTAEYIDSGKKEAAPLCPATIKELIALVLSVVSCDVLIYHGGGFTGYAIAFPFLALLLFFFSRETKKGFMVFLLMGLVLLIGFRLFYLGSIFCVLFGIFLLFAVALALRGFPPMLPETILQTMIIFLRAPLNFEDYSRRISLSTKSGKRRFSLKTILAPICAVFLFGLIFIMANPVLKDFFGEWVKWFNINLRYLIPGWKQILFWGFILWSMAGLLYPRLEEFLFKERETIDPQVFPPSPDHYYPTSRNVLYSLIALFAAYLVFEFYYLWWRDIPKGFRYSEYAHQGAAWLTFALALSTFVIGFTFQGGLLRDPRLPVLKKLAWIWSFENFILSVCAFHRTQIYVHYNGLSRMRIVAVLGISVVVAGFILVMLKVALQKNFLWLIRRHLWALALTCFLYVIIPVDYIVTRYNVNQILAGNPAPTVQIAVHPIGPEGSYLLLELLGCPDENIRKGVRALLAKTQIELEGKVSRDTRKGWTFYQLAEKKALEKIELHGKQWENLYVDKIDRLESLKRFYSYGRKWYD